jgi:aryl-alcohol dehydrogenase-like predicted oxidoreductase
MQYRTLGRTGVQVSALCLGAMNFGAMGNVDQETATAMVRRSLDAGINFFDTADVYSAGQSEELLGRALKDVDRDEVVLATKFGLPVGAMNEQGGSRRWIVRRVEQSLRRSTPGPCRSMGCEPPFFFIRGTLAFIGGLRSLRLSGLL